MGLDMARRRFRGRPLFLSRAAPAARVCRSGGAVTGARHRRQQRHLQPRRRDASASSTSKEPRGIVGREQHHARQSAGRHVVPRLPRSARQEPLLQRPGGLSADHPGGSHQPHGAGADSLCRPGDGQLLFGSRRGTFGCDRRRSARRRDRVRILAAELPRQPLRHRQRIAPQRNRLHHRRRGPGVVYRPRPFRAPQHLRSAGDGPAPQRHARRSSGRPRKARSRGQRTIEPRRVAKIRAGGTCRDRGCPGARVREDESQSAHWRYAPNSSGAACKLRNCWRWSKC
jgi:hypothetical protein